MLHLKTEATQQLQREFFHGAAIKLDWHQEGQTILGGLPVIGAKAGPSCDITHLLHEMAHFVEIDDARMCSPGWGFKVPEVFVIDRMCVEPRTIQMTERELRTIAYQRNLMEYLGLSEDPLESVQSLRYMPDYFLVPVEDGTPGYDLDYNDTLKSRDRWMANQVVKLQSEYTLKRFQSEWSRKNELLQRGHSWLQELAKKDAEKGSRPKA